jgi:hypothetical protein
VHVRLITFHIYLRFGCFGCTIVYSQLAQVHSSKGIVATLWRYVVTKRHYPYLMANSILTEWNKMKQNETKTKPKRNKMKQNETKWNKMKTKWNKMKQNETKWNQNETKRNKLKQNETKWNKMKQNENKMKQNETKWNKTKPKRNQTLGWDGHTHIVTKSGV